MAIVTMIRLLILLTALGVITYIVINSKNNSIHHENCMEQVVYVDPCLQTRPRYPNFISTLQDLHIKVVSTNDVNALINMGDMYKSGEFPEFAPNKRLAKQCYKSAGNFDSGVALAKFMGADLYNDTTTCNGAVIPVEYAETAIQHMETYLKQVVIPQRMQARARERQRQLQERQEQALQRQQAIIDVGIANIPHIVQYTRLPAERRALQRQVFNDTQNTHDTAVVACSKKNIQGLKSHDQVDMDLIKDVLKTADLSDKDRKQAYEVLDNLTDHQHGTFGTTEKKLLSNVWGTIQDMDDPRKREGAIQILGKQLAECIEHDHIVCSTGKMSHINAVLDGIDETREQSRPISVINQEIQTMAANLRNKYLDTPEKKQKYDAGDQELANGLIQKFNNDVRDIYIEKLGISENVLKPLIEATTNAF